MAIQCYRYRNWPNWSIDAFEVILKHPFTIIRYYSQRSIGNRATDWLRGTNIMRTFWKLLGTMRLSFVDSIRSIRSNWIVARRRCSCETKPYGTRRLEVICSVWRWTSFWHSGIRVGGYFCHVMACFARFKFFWAILPIVSVFQNNLQFYPLSV